MIRPRRSQLVRLVAAFGVLLLLLAASLGLQARWLGRLAEAQREETRSVLGAAARRLAAGLEEALARRAEPFPAEADEVDPDAPEHDGEDLGAEPAFAFVPEASREERVEQAKELLPALVVSSFGEEALRSYRVRVVARDGAVVLHDTHPGAAPGGSPEATARLRLEANRWTFLGEGETQALRLDRPLFVSEPGTELHRVDPGEGGDHRIEVHHVAGSLESALASARRRNLWIGAGLLAALGASFAQFLVGERRARRLAEKELAFVAGVSHELRTPLAVLRSAASNLRRGIVREGERVSEYGALIEREATRVGDSVERILRFGQRDEAPGAVELVSLAEVLGEAEDRVRLLHPARPFGLEVELPDEPRVRGERADLVTAVQNLLENAVKYGPPGQRIGVRAASEDGRVRLTVHDEGPGLRPEERETVFEAFQRGSAARSGGVAGSGLGLALVARIARAHGGSVRVEEVPRGAAFTLLLPLAPLAEGGGS